MYATLVVKVPELKSPDPELEKALEILEARYGRPVRAGLFSA